MENTNISLSEKSIGYADTDISKIKKYGTTFVSTKKELLKALKKSGIIVITKEIDLLQDSTGKSIRCYPDGKSTTAFDNFINEQTGYKTYKKFINAYLKACRPETNDIGVTENDSYVPKDSENASKMFSNLYNVKQEYESNYNVLLRPKSNTAIIGADDTAKIIGGSVALYGVKNIIIRNITFEDSFDPFPHHEPYDGFNADYDCIRIKDTSNVWIDHCSLKTTNKSIYVTIGTNDIEAWNNYDGLLDITCNSTKITVSNCKFEDHEKTMLIGNSDNEEITSNRKITLMNNYFKSCRERTPMVRNSDIHIYNNIFEGNKNYCIGIRQGAKIIAENNVFKDVNVAFKGDSATKKATLYQVNEFDNVKTLIKNKYWSNWSGPTFTVSYDYALLTTDEVKETIPVVVGAGKYLEA